MLRNALFSVALMLVALPAIAKDAKTTSAGGSDWKMTASVIEACSCPMFCQCYFNSSPGGTEAAMPGMEGHEAHGGHSCKFNNAYLITKGDYKGTKLDGDKFWIYGDLGGDFSKGQMDWAVVTFDKAVPADHRAAIGDICGHLFPVKWNSLTTAEGDIDWHGGKDEAYATLDGGKTAEVRLSTKTLNRYSNAEPIVIKNLKYWGATSHDGFVLMPNTVEAVHTGDKPYEFQGTNGFMMTMSIDSKHAPPAASGQ